MSQPEPAAVRPAEGFRLADIDLGLTLGRRAYEVALKAVGERLHSLQHAYIRDGARGIVVLEGWDAAGKGGVIRRLNQFLDPRACKVWPIGVPQEEEHGRHYLYRFWRRLPEPGTMAVFDRSWYGRVLVERVEKLATKDQWQRAYREIRDFERMLTDDGVYVVKLFLHISDEEQVHRFRERWENPLKRWKLTADDFRNRKQRGAYVTAVEDMIRETGTPNAPWLVVPGESKRYARISALDAIAEGLTDGLDLTPGPLDPAVTEFATKAFGKR